MTPSEILALAAAESITIEARGSLVILTPPRAASPELRAALKEQKAAVLALLADGARSPPNGNGHYQPQADATEKEEDDPSTETPIRRRRNTLTLYARALRILLHRGSGLGEAELRVYLFILGQTAAWGKLSDSISYAQMRDGIRRRNGEVWSTGTGLATRTIINAVHSLAERKLITCTPNSDPKYGHVANIYTLILEGLPE